MTDEVLQVPLPKGFRPRKDKDCALEGHLCLEDVNGNRVCGIPIFRKNEKGEFELFEFKPCKKNPRGFEI
jgi:hypothetical protein